MLGNVVIFLFPCIECVNVIVVSLWPTQFTPSQDFTQDKGVLFH